MHIYKHTYTQTQTHAYIYTHIKNTYIHMYAHIQIHTYVYTYIHTYMHACIHTYIQTSGGTWSTTNKDLVPKYEYLHAFIRSIKLVDFYTLQKNIQWLVLANTGIFNSAQHFIFWKFI